MDFNFCLLCGFENDFKMFSSIFEIKEDFDISYSEKIINIFNFEVTFYFRVKYSIIVFF